MKQQSENKIDIVNNNKQNNQINLQELQQSSIFSSQNIKKYGTIGLITHMSMSWSILAMTYLAVHRSGKGPILIKKLKLQNKIPQKAGSFVISGIIYKAIMPLRIGLSLLILPLIFKVLPQQQMKIKQ